MPTRCCTFHLLQSATRKFAEVLQILCNSVTMTIIFRTLQESDSCKFVRLVQEICNTFALSESHIFQKKSTTDRDKVSDLVPLLLAVVMVNTHKDTANQLSGLSGLRRKHMINWKVSYW